MLTTTTTELIHRVLDGEASEAQAQQLQQLLAAEPAARAEFGPCNNCSPTSRACRRSIRPRGWWRP